MSNFYSPSTNGLYESFFSRSLENDLLPSDSIEITNDLYHQLVSGISSGKVIKLINEFPSLVDPIISTSQQMAINENAIQLALDSMAQSRGYSSIKSACSYAAESAIISSTNVNFVQCEKYRMEGNALKIWMTQTWAAAYAYLLTVQGGLNPMPTADQSVKMIPTFTWPD